MATLGSPMTKPLAPASTSDPQNWTLKKAIQCLVDHLPSTGVSFWSLFKLSDKDTAKKIEDVAFNALIGLGTVYCLTNSFKLPVFIGAALYGAVKAKPEEVYQKPIDLIGTYLPLGEEKTGLLSLFVKTDEKATPEQKLKTVSNLFLAVLIANLFSPWLVQRASAIFFGYKAVEWIHGTQIKTDPAAAKPVEKRAQQDGHGSSLGDDAVLVNQDD